MFVTQFLREVLPPNPTEMAAAVKWAMGPVSAPSAPAPSIHGHCSGDGSRRSRGRQRGWPLRQSTGDDQSVAKEPCPTTGGPVPVIRGFMDLSFISIIKLLTETAPYESHSRSFWTTMYRFPSKASDEYYVLQKSHD